MLDKDQLELLVIRDVNALFTWIMKANRQGPDFYPVDDDTDTRRNLKSLCLLFSHYQIGLDVFVGNILAYDICDVADLKLNDIIELKVDTREWMELPAVSEEQLRSVRVHGWNNVFHSL